MTQSRKTNQDHAKKKQRPMVEDEVIAFQLEALLTPAITNQENSSLVFYSNLPNLVAPSIQ